jgi:threonine dehydrogenase-like Zn-dependent dehydrogenase
VWGCGPVGQFAIQSAWLFGAGRVIAIDCVPERLEMAKRLGRAEVIDFMKAKDSVYDALQEMTKGRGPDRCIDAVGAEAHGWGSAPAVVDNLKAAVGLGTDRPAALRQAVFCCRKGGTVSVPGVYSFVDKMPMGAFINKSLVMKTGQTHVHRYLKPLTERIQKGEIDPAAIITHRLPLADAPKGYQKFRDKQDGCVKVVLKP